MKEISQNKNKTTENMVSKITSESSIEIKDEIENPILQFKICKINDINNIDDDFFLKHKLNIIKTSKNINPSCLKYITESVFLYKTKFKKKIFQHTVNPKIIKEQIIKLINYLIKNFLNKPSICFFNPKKFSYISLDDKIKEKILTYEQIYFDKWISGILSNFNVILYNKQNLWTKFKQTNKSTFEDKRQLKKYIHLEKRLKTFYNGWPEKNTVIDFIFLTNLFINREIGNEIKNSNKKIIALCLPIHRINEIDFPILINTKNPKSLKFIFDILFWFLDFHYNL